VALVLLVGLLYALPNIYPQDPVIEVTGTRGEQVGETLRCSTVVGALSGPPVPIKSAELQADRLQIRFGAPRPAGDRMSSRAPAARVHQRADPVARRAPAGSPRSAVAR
jgi:xanthosine utilization system XapX-like protein